MKILILLAVPVIVLIVTILALVGYAILRKSGSSKVSNGTGAKKATGKTNVWKNLFRVVCVVVGLLLVMAIVWLILSPSASGKLIAFLIVIAVLIAIAAWVYSEHKDKEDKWGQIVRNNATMTFLGLIVLNAIAYILHYEGWRKFYDMGSLFWMTNIGIILFVYLIFEKSQAAKVVAAVLALLILTALWGKKDGMNIFNRTPTISLSQSYDNVPTEIAFPIIGECESPGEPGGKQFEKDKNGKMIVVQGKVDKDDTGALQINKRIHADLIKEHPEIDISKSKEENYKFGKVLVEKFHGYGPWFKTRSCWEPKFASLGYNDQQGVRWAEVETPTERYGDLQTVQPGQSATIYEEGNLITALWNEKVEEDLPRQGDPKAPSRVFSFRLKSREQTPLKIKVKFF